MPKPKNDYEIVAPEDEEHEETGEGVDTNWVEDASEAEEERAKRRAIARMKELAKRSQVNYFVNIVKMYFKVIQRGLPQPTKVNDAAFKSSGNRSDAHRVSCHSSPIWRIVFGASA